MAHGFSSGGSQASRAASLVVAYGFSCSAACGIFLDQESNLCAWENAYPLGHQGSPQLRFLRTYFSLSIASARGRRWQPSNLEKLTEVWLKKVEFIKCFTPWGFLWNPGPVNCAWEILANPQASPEGFSRALDPESIFSYLCRWLFACFCFSLEPL